MANDTHGSGAQPHPRAASNEEIRLAALRRDARRPKGELLDEAMSLSSAIVEMARAGKRTRP